MQLQLKAGTLITKMKKCGKKSREQIQFIRDHSAKYNINKIATVPKHNSNSVTPF